MQELTEEMILANAKQFSEGSKALEQVLLNLWGMGIETFACCKGTNGDNHEEYDIMKTPYLSILITKESAEKVKSLMRYLCNDSTYSRPNMHIFKDDANIENRVSLLLDRICLSNSGCENMFNHILRATESMKSEKQINKENPDLELVFEMIDEFLNRKFNSFALFSQAEVRYSHNNLKPRFILTSHEKLNCVLTNRTKGKVAEALSLTMIKEEGSTKSDPTQGEREPQ